MTIAAIQRLTSLAVCCLLVLPLLSCGGGDEPSGLALDRPLILLIDHLDLRPPVTDGKPEPAQLTLEGEQREIVYAHPPHEIRFRLVPRAGTRLRFGAALRPAVWTLDRGDGARFTVTVEPESGEAPGPLYQRWVNPRQVEADRGWCDGEADLSAWAGEPVTVVLRTDGGPEGDEEFDWAVWSDPRIVTPPPARETHPENLILITADTLRADHLGSYGADLPLTPHLDRLARSGAQFSRTWSQFNTTNASHCSIMTSLYGPSHGVTDNLQVLHHSRLTLAEILSGEGWYCGAVTSVAHLGPVASGLGQGFRNYHHVELERRAAESVDTALAWLERNGDSPFMLWLHLFDPHIFYEPGNEFLPRRPAVEAGGDWPAVIREQEAQREAELAAGGEHRAYQWDGPFFMNEPMRELLLGEPERRGPGRAYAGEVAYLDFCIGRLLAGLRALGLEGSTAVVFTADHGESLGEHEIYFDHRGLYDVSLQVPLLMRLPRIAGGDLLESNLAETVDILPTCLQTLGLGAPEGIQGQSLLTLLEGGAPGGVRGAVYAQHADSMAFTVSDGTWKLIVQESDHPMITASGGDELYNLERDPGETRNLLRENPEEMARLAEMLQRWLSLTTRDDVPQAPAIDDLEMERRKEKLKALGYLQ
jgi:arylsulfatase A-like enzyme